MLNSPQHTPGRHPWRRLLVAASTVALVAGLTATAGPAAAAHVSCGDVITQDTTLDSDLGPCPGHGLIVTASNITLDLGHTVFAQNGPEERVGILLRNVTGVTVENGTVEGFDAGIAINGGSGNTVTRVTAQDNVNDMLEPFPFTPRTALPPEQLPLMLGNYGDGITTFASDNNLIEHNRVIGNGPYSGIALVDDSDGNVVRRNMVQDNNVRNFTTRFDGSEGPGLCGATLPGAPGMQRGREVQAIGIRVEGPGAADNHIQANAVDKSALVGISVHSYVCNPEPGEPRGEQEPNVRNLIEHNIVRQTGAETVQFDPFADGIASLAQGPIGRVTCTSPDNTFRSNRSIGNMRHGISLGRTTRLNEVVDNIVNQNGDDGIRVYEDAVENVLHRNRGHQNGEHDGHDDNPNCDANDWQRNRFRSVNQPCVASNGTGWVDGPANAPHARGVHDQAQVANRGRPNVNA